MQAIILCGGLGTRLRQVVSEVPKPMAPIYGKPFMQILVDNLVKAGVNKIIFAVGYKKEIIKDFFGDNYKDVTMIYSEEDHPLLTGGAMKQALQFVDEDNALILNGDCYLNLDYKKIFQQHVNSSAMETMAVKPMYNFDRYGNVIMDESGRIVEFREKEPTPFGHANVGCYVVRKDIFNDYEKELGNEFSHEVNYVTKHLKDHKICGYIHDGYFIDIGIPEDYYAFCDYVKQQKKHDCDMSF